MGLTRRGCCLHVFLIFRGKDDIHFLMGITNSCGFLALAKYLLYLYNVIFMDFTFGQCEGANNN